MFPNMKQCFMCKNNRNMISVTTVPETNIAAENQWLEDYPFLLGVGLFVRGELSVLGKASIFISRLLVLLSVIPKPMFWMSTRPI